MEYKSKDNCGLEKDLLNISDMDLNDSIHTVDEAYNEILCTRNNKLSEGAIPNELNESFYENVERKIKGKLKTSKSVQVKVRMKLVATQTKIDARKKNSIMVKKFYKRHIA